jgi:hypothetical protein
MVLTYRLMVLTYRLMLLTYRLGRMTGKSGVGTQGREIGGRYAGPLTSGVWD